MMLEFWECDDEVKLALVDTLLRKMGFKTKFRKEFVWTKLNQVEHWNCVDGPWHDSVKQGDEYLVWIGVASSQVPQNPLPCQSGNLTRWQCHPSFTRLSECAKGQYDHTQIQLWQTTQIRCLPAFVGILIISSDETFLARTVFCPQPNGMQNGKRWYCNQGDIYFSLLDTYRVFFFTGTPLKS